MSKAWLPTGRLSDGTLLFGPLKERPDGERIVVVEVEGVSWYVRHSGDVLAPALQAELAAWVRQRLQERPR